MHTGLSTRSVQPLPLKTIGALNCPVDLLHQLTRLFNSVKQGQI